MKIALIKSGWGLEENQNLLHGVGLKEQEGFKSGTLGTGCFQSNENTDSVTVCKTWHFSEKVQFSGMQTLCRLHFECCKQRKLFPYLKGIIISTFLIFNFYGFLQLNRLYRIPIKGIINALMNSFFFVKRDDLEIVCYLICLFSFFSVMLWF